MDRTEAIPDGAERLLEDRGEHLGAVGGLGRDEGAQEEGVEMHMLDQDGSSVNPNEPPAMERKAAKPPPTPLPWKGILLISMASLTDFIVQTMYLPMYPAICEQFYQAEHLGVCVGVLNGMVNLGTALTATFMGFFSDHFGRKVPMLWGLFIGMTAITVLVTSRSYTFTAVMLCLAGMLDPVLPSSKSAIADITDKSNRASAYGVRATSSAVGRTWWILLLSVTYGSGVVIGGNPFLFAGLAGILSYLAVIIACWFLMPETHPVLGGGTVPKFHLLMHKKKDKDSNQNKLDQEPDAKKTTGDPESQAVAADSTDKKPKFVMGYRFHHGALFIFLNPVLRQIFILKFLQTAINSAVQTVLVLYMVLPDAYGGLGLSSKLMMYLLVAYFTFGTISLVFVYPKLCARYTLRHVYIFYQAQGTLACVLMVFAHALVKFGGNKIDYSDVFTDVRVTVILILALGMQGFALANMPLLQSMIANASDPSLQGLTTGLSQVIIALARSTVGGPLWFGALFSAAKPLHQPWVVWLVLGALQAYTVFGMYMMKDDYQVTFAQWLEERKAKKERKPEGHKGFDAMVPKVGGDGSFAALGDAGSAPTDIVDAKSE